MVDFCPNKRQVRRRMQAYFVLKGEALRLVIANFLCRNSLVLQLSMQVWSYVPIKLQQENCYFLHFFFKLSIFIASEWGLLSSCGTCASQRGGFSCGRAQARQLQHTQVLPGMWDPPGSGIKCIVLCIGRRIGIHCTTREVWCEFLRPLKSRGGIECDYEGCSLWH